MIAVLRLLQPNASHPAKSLYFGGLLLIGFYCSTGSALAVEDGKSELAALRSVIIGQIEAFRSGDAEDAYEFSTPKIKSMFPTPEAFMAMVRRGYEPVFGAENYSFEELSIVDGRMVQPVRIEDKGSLDPIIAMFLMEKQSDGSWKIGGCILVKDRGQSV